MALAVTQEPYAGANPKEIAKLVVGGMYYSDWETVWVQHRWHDPYNYFRFTAAERDPVPALWDRIQFKPGDPCGIYLGGVLALTGIILVRQVAYEANSHGVSLQGKGKAWEITGSILPEEGDGGGNFKGDLTSVVSQVLAPTSVRIGGILGTIDGTPINEKNGGHFQQGESRYQFIERLARMRNVDIANNKNGDVVLVGPHAVTANAAVIEGENIISAQVVINGEDKYTYVLTSGQRPPDDQTNGTAASEMRAKVTTPDPPGVSVPEFRPLLVPIEHPVLTQHEVEMRAEKEARFAGTRIDADIVVYGWFDQNGELWKVGTEVIVNSPMVPTDDLPGGMLTIVTATFTQDSNSGTRTSLHLEEPWRTNASGGAATDAPTAKAGTATAPPDGNPGDKFPAQIP